MTSPVNYVDPTGHWFAPPELIDGDHWRSGPLRNNDPRVVPEPEPEPAPEPAPTTGSGSAS